MKIVYYWAFSHFSHVSVVLWQLIGCMHSVNVVFLIVDSALNSLVSTCLGTFHFHWIASLFFCCAYSNSYV